MTFQAENDINVAVICCGYADGYPRNLSNKGSVLIKNLLCPIIGRVCMDMFMVDISGVLCAVGDEVELFGKNINVNDFAKLSDTIGYEIVCGISKRVPRIYKQYSRLN
jgi:alanine racemase